MLFTFAMLAHDFTVYAGVRGPYTLRHWVSRGQVPYQMIHGRVFFDPDALEKFLVGKAVAMKNTVA